MLPTFEEIKKWTDEKLDSVIKSGENINWDCGIDESQHEIDNYVESVYSERDNRLSTNKAANT